MTVAGRRRLGWFAAARVVAREVVRRRPGGRVAVVREAVALVGRGLRGGDPHLSRSRALAYVLAVAYVLSPLDLAPEILLPLVGVVDDAGVLVWLVGNLLHDVDRAAQRRTVSGVVVDVA